MQADDAEIIKKIRNSNLLEKLEKDAELDRLEKRRKARKFLKQYREKDEPLLRQMLEDAAAEVAAKQSDYQAKKAEVIAAGAELFLSDERRREIQEELARRAADASDVLWRSANPRRFELLWNPLREEIHALRSVRPKSESVQRPGSTRLLPEMDHFASKPSILARIEFLTRAVNAAMEFLQTYEGDDDDATFIRIREAILTNAPSVETLVKIEPDQDGFRNAIDREITAAIAKAEALAQRGFDLAQNLEAKNA